MEEWFRLSEDEALVKLGAGKNGLDSREVLKRRQIYGPNRLKKKRNAKALSRYFWTSLKTYWSSS